MRHIIYLSILLTFTACTTIQSQDNAEDFNSYWYGGEAEITSYELTQARYGELHKGEAVLVYVTEPFSQSKQVKLDDWKNDTPDNVSVLKLNTTKKFITGIYPYSMMSSSFTPVSYDKHPDVIKVTTSSQEWCGQAFMQLNLVDDGYLLKGYSYFESEGDVEIKLSKTLLEDEIWTRIRLNPNDLPTGAIQILPGTFYLRLKHQEVAAVSAKAKTEVLKTSSFSTTEHQRYTLDYADRSLSIYFESSFPHTILGWEETYLSGYGNAKKLTTTAKQIKTIKSAYWGKHNNEDRSLRKELGLGVE